MSEESNPETPDESEAPDEYQEYLEVERRLRDE